MERKNIQVQLKSLQFLVEIRKQPRYLSFELKHSGMRVVEVNFSSCYEVELWVKVFANYGFDAVTKEIGSLFIKLILDELYLDWKKVQLQMKERDVEISVATVTNRDRFYVDLIIGLMNDPRTQLFDLTTEKRGTLYDVIQVHRLLDSIAKVKSERPNFQIIASADFRAGECNGVYLESTPFKTCLKTGFLKLFNRIVYKSSLRAGSYSYEIRTLLASEGTFAVDVSRDPMYYPTVDRVFRKLDKWGEGKKLVQLPCIPSNAALENFARQHSGCILELRTMDMFPKSRIKDIPFIYEMVRRTGRIYVNRGVWKGLLKYKDEKLKVVSFDYLNCLNRPLKYYYGNYEKSSFEKYWLLLCISTPGVAEEERKKRKSYIGRKLVQARDIVKRLFVNQFGKLASSY